MKLHRTHRPLSSGSTARALLGLALLGITLPTGAATPASFATRQTSPTHPGPADVTVADYNADGKPDALTANPTDNSVSVLIGNGSGTFAAPNPLPFLPNTHPNAISTGKYNDDGNLDIVYTGRRLIESLLGDGANDVTASGQLLILDIPSVQPLHGIAAAEFEENGQLDAAALTSDARIVFLLNKGAGVASGFRFEPLAATAVDLAAGEVSGDGHQDVVTVDAQGRASFLSGKGDGTFYPRKDLTVPAGAARVRFADVTGDNKQDIVAAGPGFVSVLPGDGNGNFGAAVTSTVSSGSGAVSLAVGDFNLDGLKDVAVGYGNLSFFFVLLNQGNGAFAQSQTLTIGNGVGSLAVGDFNADGKTDLIAADTRVGEVDTYLNTTVPPQPPQQADAQVQLTAEPILSLGYVRYVVRVTNLGPAPLSTASVRAALPAGLSANSTECTASTGSVTCGFGPLQPNATQARTFTVPLSLFPLLKLSTVTATRVSSTPADPNGANDQASRACLAVGPLNVICL